MFCSPRDGHKLSANALKVSDVSNTSLLKYRLLSDAMGRVSTVQEAQNERGDTLEPNKHLGIHYWQITTCSLKYIKAVYSQTFQNVTMANKINRLIYSLSYFPFLYWLSTLAGYQFLSPHLAITVLPTDTDDVDASGLIARLS